MPFGETEADQTVALPYGQEPDPEPAEPTRDNRTLLAAALRTAAVAFLMTGFAWAYVKGQP